MPSVFDDNPPTPTPLLFFWRYLIRVYSRILHCTSLRMFVSDGNFICIVIYCFIIVSRGEVSKKFTFIPVGAQPHFVKNAL